VLAEAVETLKAEPPTPHDFRRTVATGMAVLGIPREDRLAVLAHLQGDIHGSVYDKYERLKEKRVALETWERHVQNLLDRAPGPARSVGVR
jgi:integrase